MHPREGYGEGMEAIAVTGLCARRYRLPFLDCHLDVQSLRRGQYSNSP